MPLNARIAEWKDRRVWLVGASTGIGAALARALLARGARVAVSARSAGRLRSLVAGRGEALVLPLDVTRPEDFDAAHARILKAWGAVDLAVYLAGTYQPTRAWELTVERARTHVEANLMGAFNLLPVILPDMLARGAGGVALVSSVAGYRGLPNSLCYGPTKAALINLAEALYVDLAPKGIGVYLINPGFVETPLTAQNTFKMPALIAPEDAAEAIIKGLERGAFEIHFPKRFTGWLKALRQLPYAAYFPAVRRFTGL
jgi:NAD(P)-dependent dehydrogenase (short-subunit alcohol dehydrogenase family)